MIGQTIGGYRVEAELGRGGQAVVYRATQLSLERAVALKVVSPQLASDEGFLERFKREGVSAASLDHPNVIPVYESGEADGVAFLSMKLVDGPTLDHLMRGRGALPPARVVAILRQVADALDYVHERGLVHRDVKPANVLLGGRDHAYLSDFGLSKALQSAKLTRSGTWMGTLEYIAPEQIRGGQVTGAADRYALAIMAYEALTGRAPFVREDRTALLYAHLNDAPPPPSEVRPALGPAVDGVILTGLAKDPADRHATARAFVDALEAAVPGAPAAAAPTTVAPAAPAPPTTTGPAPARRPRPRWIPWAVGGGVAAVGAVVLVVALAGGGGGDRTVTTVVNPPPPPTATTAATGQVIGDVLPASVAGFTLAATEPRPANLELPTGAAVETAQATRGGEVAQVTAARPADGDAGAALAEVEGQVGLSPVGAVPLPSATGRLYRPGGANVVAFAQGGVVVVVSAVLRNTAVDAAAAVSAGLAP